MQCQESKSYMSVGRELYLPFVKYLCLLLDLEDWELAVAPLGHVTENAIGSVLFVSHFESLALFGLAFTSVTVPLIVIITSGSFIRHTLALPRGQSRLTSGGESWRFERLE